MKKKFKINGESLETPDNCESVTIRTGRDEEFVFQSLGCYNGPIDFYAPECAEIESNFMEHLPDQFDAIFCGVEYGMMKFLYGSVALSTPVETFQDKVKYLKHGDLVTIKIR